MKKGYTFPGFVDVHVHFRDPGMPGAENRRSGASAAWRGGFSAVVTMPNTTPAGDNVEWIKEQLEDETLPVKIYPSACISRSRAGEEVADLEELAQAGAAFFTDDGSYVKSDKVMEEAMARAAELNMCICDHAMDPDILNGGVIRKCALADALKLPVISEETEVKAISRDISLCRVTGCRIHIQHISTSRGVELVRMAQREGLPITAEATPHHLLLCTDDITRDDAAFKMAPPLGNREDLFELRRGVKDGVLMFATDHAPHSFETKNKGFLNSANGIVGLETAIPITYSVMVEEEGMDIESWAKAWYEMPRWIIRGVGDLKPTTIEVGEKRRVSVNDFYSLSRNCPYDGMEFDCWAVDR